MLLKHDSTVPADALRNRINTELMVDTKNGQERSFPDFYSAFYFIGNLRNNHLASIDILELDQQYYVRARARLQAEKLPLPLRIKSYFSPDWRPSSGWTSWPM